MKLIQFEQCTLVVNHEDRYMATVFYDGAKAEARPNFSIEDVARAHDLGYLGDTWQMTLDHESLHSLVGELFGYGHSVVLWNVAYDNPKRWPKWGKEEEGFTTSLQRYLNTGYRDDLVWGLFNQARERHGLYEQQVERMARGLLQEVRA